MSNDNEVLVKVEGVSKVFCRDFKKSLRYGLQDSARDLFTRGKNKEPGTKHKEQGARALRDSEFYAVSDVSFELRRGECLGLIGRNGAGKTTLLKMLNGLIKPDAGRIEMRGRVGALIALGAGFNPILSGRENIYINGSVLGLSKEEIDAKIEEIIDFAEIREFIDAPVQTYSSGMQVRLGFAVATAMEPDVLILDEVLAVGDRKFRSNCMKRISQVIDKCAVMLVSHNPGNIQQICDRVILLDKGSVQFDGNTSEALSAYSRASKVSVMGTVNLLFPVTNASLEIAHSELQWGDDLNIRFLVNSESEVVTDYFVGAIVDEAGETVAQFNPEWRERQFLGGLNEFTVCVKNLRLSPGNYSVNALCCSSRGKRVLFHLSQFATFHTAGGANLWSSYQPETN